ncbi:MAG: tyrosine-type recombinase/integrase [Solirubrobacteraceae bacterium]
MPSFHEGRAPRNKGRRYPADPPTVEEIIAVMRAAGDGADGARLRALIVILWRAGLRIGEALDLAETDLDPSRGAVLVRRGKGGRRREVGMDRWAWSQLEPWIGVRRRLPVGAFLCVIRGVTAGRHWEPSSARKQLSRIPARQGCGGGLRARAELLRRAPATITARGSRQVSPRNRRLPAPRQTRVARRRSGSSTEASALVSARCGTLNSFAVRSAVAQEQVSGVVV